MTDQMNEGSDVEDENSGVRGGAGFRMLTDDWALLSQGT